MQDVRKYQYRYQQIREEAARDLPVPTENEELRSGIIEAVRVTHPTAMDHNLEAIADLPTEREEKEAVSVYETTLPNTSQTKA